MEQNQSLYDENHPFYYDSHLDQKIDETNRKKVQEAVRQVTFYVVTLIVMFIIVGVAQVILHWGH